MFSAEHRVIAARLISCATEGFRGAKLIACVRDEHPDATWQDLISAAFLAATRRDADQATVLTIYDVAILLRQAHKFDH